LILNKFAASHQMARLILQPSIFWKCFYMGSGTTAQC